MKTVVITGSARGFGYELARNFRLCGYNVVLSDVNKASLDVASKAIVKAKSKGKVHTVLCDVTKEKDVQNLIFEATTKFKTIDIWINNAGVNQPNKAIMDIDTKTIDKLLDIDLKGTIICSREVMKIMTKQGFGAIYNVEGYGSNGSTMLGLSIYGTCKSAITYFTKALAKECKTLKNNIIVGYITPGIMITNFVKNSCDGKEIILDDKTKNVYNILGDKPNTIAEYMVPRIIKNKKNNKRIIWLTNIRAMGRFIKSMFNKKNKYF